MSRRILAPEPRQLRAITIECVGNDRLEFRQWRTSLHNFIDYRRRQSRWWRSVGMWAWWNGDRMRGLVELGSIAESEFMVALRRHGTVDLRSIETSNVRTEVYGAVLSRSAVSSGNRSGRYQPIKIAVEPAINATLPRPPIAIIEAMPVIF